MNGKLAANLKSIVERYDLSVRRITTTACTIGAMHVSKSTVHRILQGITRSKLSELAVPAVRDAVIDLATARGADRSELLNLLDLEDESDMLADRCPLSPEILKHFNLRFDPFDVDRLPVGDELFTNRDLDAVATRVRDSVLYQRFTAVIGPVGSGKTLLKLRVADELGDNAKLLYPEFFDMAEVSVHGIANRILEELGQRVPRNKEARVTKIKSVLTGLQQEGVRVAIVLDECHRLNDRVISSLKNFWEMTNGRTSRLLGVLLFGQPAFVESRLRDSVFREIRQRVQIIQMPDLKKSGADYLRHRIELAGGNFEKLFEPEAVKKLLLNATTPLALGNLAAAAMMSAFACDEKTVTVDLPFFRTLPANAGVLQVRKVGAA